MLVVRGRKDSRVIVTANPSKNIRDRSSSDEVMVVSSNPIERYNHFIRQYNRECNKVNRYTLKELPLIDLDGEHSEREIDNLERIFQSNHEQVAYCRCYERMQKTVQCENRDQYFQYLTMENVIINGDSNEQSGIAQKPLKVMQYTQRWVEKNNKAFNRISSFIEQYKNQRQTHA